MDTTDIDTEISELKAKVISTQAKLKELAQLTELQRYFMTNIAL